MKITSNIGMLLLAIWLIISGVIVLIPSLAFTSAGTILACLAIAAGVCILIGR